MNLRNPVYTYNFTTSQPLTQSQIDWINNELFENLPTEDLEDLSDIPEWNTEIELISVEELID